MMKKKTLFFIAAALLALNTISGQEKSKISFQLNAGTNLSIPSDRGIRFFQGHSSYYTRDYQAVLSYCFEVVANKDFGEHLDLSLGVDIFQNKNRYNEKNYRYTGLEFLPDQEIEGKLKQNYMSVSLVPKFKISEKFPLSIGMGFYFACLLYTKEKNDSESSIVENLYKPVDVGITPQVEYVVFSNSRYSVSMFAKYNLSLSDDPWHEEFLDSPDKRWRNESLKVGIGLGI